MDFVAGFLIRLLCGIVALVCLSINQFATLLYPIFEE
jgi:hypothetical protein